MRQDFAAIKENINNFVSSFFIPGIKNSIDDTLNFIQSFKKRLFFFNDIPAASLEEVNEYNSKTYSLIENKFTESHASNFSEEFTSFNEALNNYLSTLDETVKEVQLDERFSVASKDTIFIKNLKRIKKPANKISQFPVNAVNIPRKILKKEPKPAKNWYHIIPYRNFSLLYLRDKLSRLLIEIIEEADLNISSAYSKIWELDEKLNSVFTNDPAQNEIDDKSLKEINFKEEVENIIKFLTELKDSFEEKASGKVDEIFIKYEDAYNKVGTIEEPKRKYSSQKIKRSNENLNNDYKEIKKGWQNTFFTLFEEWRLNKELYILCGNSAKAYSKIKEDSEERINKRIVPGLKKITSLLEDIKLEINEFYGDSGELLSLLYRKKDKIFKQLTNKIIPSVSETILAQNIPELAGGIEINIEKLVQNLSTQRAIIKLNTYSRKVKNSEIDYISPKEIISFASLTKFSKSIQHVKNNILREIQKVQSSITDIDQISDFNLDTAISMFRSNERTGEDPLDIAAEGIERAIGKTNEVEKTLLTISKEIEEIIGNAVSDFNGDLIKLTKTENILDIKIKIAKAKALQRTTKLKEQSIVWIKNFIPVLKTSYEKEHGRYKEFYNYIRKKIGLTKRLAAISSEISDFLAATQTALSKLPVVYRRLFEIEALKDERFFEGRETELSKLNLAYEQWGKGGYAPVAVIGEKGSGATTLLNFFEMGLEKKYNILRTEVSKEIHEPDDLKEFLKILFNISSIKDFEELIGYLNNLPKKIIVIIENIQHLFLRKVNGFACLKILFELILKNSKEYFLDFNFISLFVGILT